MTDLDDARQLIGDLYRDAHAKAEASDTRIDKRAWVHRGREEAFAQALAILSSPLADLFAGLESTRTGPLTVTVPPELDGRIKIEHHHSRFGQWVEGGPLPGQFTRVEALVGYGYPELSYRLRKSRNFTRPADARRWLNALAWPPHHHQLVGLWQSGAVTWTPIVADDLPPAAPETEDDPDA